MKHRSHRRRTSQVAASEMTGVEQRDDESPWVRRAVRITGRPDIMFQKGLIPGSPIPQSVAPPITIEEPRRCMTKVTATSFVTAMTMRCDNGVRTRMKGAMTNELGRKLFRAPSASRPARVMLLKTPTESRRCWELYSAVIALASRKGWRRHHQLHTPGSDGSDERSVSSRTR
jgi:hypothetical protein